MNQGRRPCNAAHQEGQPARCSGALGPRGLQKLQDKREPECTTHQAWHPLAACHRRQDPGSRRCAPLQPQGNAQQAHMCIASGAHREGARQTAGRGATQLRGVQCPQHPPLQSTRSLVMALLPLTLSELEGYTGTCTSIRRATQQRARVVDRSRSRSSQPWGPGPRAMDARAARCIRCCMAPQHVRPGAAALQASAIGTAKCAEGLLAARAPPRWPCPTSAPPPWVCPARHRAG